MKSKYNKGIRYSLCVIDIFSKYAWVVPLKDKKIVTIVNVFQISKIKNTVPWTYAIRDLNGEKIVGTFYEKELQKTNTNQKEFRIEKVIKRAVY